MENTQAFLHAARKYSNTLSEHVAKVLNITNVHNKGQKRWQNCLPDNAKTYLCRYGVPEQEVFQTPDLFERRNLPQVAQLQNAQGIFEINVVLHCLYYLTPKLERPILAAPELSQCNSNSLTIRCGQFSFTQPQLTWQGSCAAR